MRSTPLEAQRAPVIEVIVGPGSISIQDNAGGFAAGTIESILDYSVRVSSREAYVSPTRGAQGNALKTILAMAYVLDRRSGEGDVIETRGRKHRIEFRVDHVNNQPKLTHTVSPSDIKGGTKITVQWPTSEALLQYAEQQFKELLRGYTWFNPHLALRGVWYGGEFVNATATNPNWDKWRPRDPTSPHWYDEGRLQRYLGAHVARDHDLKRQRTVREFVASSADLLEPPSRKKYSKRSAAHTSRSRNSSASIRSTAAASPEKLLAAMRKYSKPVRPKHLGVIGAEHLKQRFLEAGGNAETFSYQQRKDVSSEGIPHLVEIAFGLHQSGLTEGAPATRRLIVTGANWSVGINNPFRSFGRTEGLETTLAKVRAAANQPVICAVHLAMAHVQYSDRGKSAIILTDDAEQPDD